MLLLYRRRLFGQLYKGYNAYRHLSKQAHRVDVAERSQAYHEKVVSERVGFGRYLTRTRIDSRTGKIVVIFRAEVQPLSSILPLVNESL